MQAEQQKNQQLTSSSRAPTLPALRENREAAEKIDGMIAGCFMIQKVYGRSPESIAVVNQTFHSVLGKYRSDLVIKAFETWLERSQEFPTPADIIGLIKRNGKPPMKESDIIAIRKKDGEDRSREEWEMLKQWDREQTEAWSDSDIVDTEKHEATVQENIRLRQEIRKLNEEITRLGKLLHEERVSKGLEKPAATLEHKVRKTVAAMRSAGGAEADVETFVKAEGFDISLFPAPSPA